MQYSEFSIQNSEEGASRALWSREKNTVSKGFTLVELLAAMSILVVITLIVSKLFQQASVAWDTGLRKAENTMKGRAIADYIAQDLASAVQDDNLCKEFTGNGSAPEFWSIGEAGGATRAIRFVKYDASGGGISRTEDSGTPIQLVASNATLTVSCVGGTATNLPVYATVKVVVTDGARTVQYQSTAYFGQNKRNTF